MKRQVFTIERYAWHVIAFYDFTEADAEVISRELLAIVDNKESYRRAMKLILTGDYNSGFTFTNFAEKVSLMAISRTEDATQFYNTLQHEQRHLETHIARAYNLDPYGEEICYLAGDIATKMFSGCKDLLCDCCRKKSRIRLHA